MQWLLENSCDLPRLISVGRGFKMFFMMIFFIMAVLLLLYLVILSLVYSGGVPVSLSSVYYSMEEEGWLFQFLMLAIPMMLLPVWLEVSDDVHRWLAFLSCGCVMAVGAAPSFKIPLEGLVHYSAAALCCVCSVAWQLAEGLWDVMLWFGVTGGMLALMWREKWCWWLECAVIGSVVSNIWRVL